MDICVEFHGYADCEACCGPCSSCTSMQAVSTSYPHDEANCESRAAAICGGSIEPGQGPGYDTQQEYNPYHQFSSTGEEGCTHDGDCHKGQSCVNNVCVDGGIKRPPMERTVQLRESELVNLIKIVINEREANIRMLGENWRDTSWEDDEGKITIGDITDYLGNDIRNISVSDLQDKLGDNVSSVTQGEERIMKADLQYPILLVQKDGEFSYVLDGNHRLAKAIMTGEDYIKAKVLYLDDKNTPEEFKRLLGRE